ISWYQSRFLWLSTSAVAIAPRKKLELAGRSTAELETSTSPLPVNNHPTAPCGRCCRAERLI
ncbi:hypothetical protein EK904_010695, partial [Melospiza melodia maxima]